MGAIDITVPSVAAPVDTPSGFVVTPGADDLDHGSEKPDRSVLGAAFRQDNSIGSFLSNEVTDSRFVPVDPNFRPFDAIKGTKYEARWKAFADVSNEAGLEQVKRQIDKEEEDRKTLAAAPAWQSLPAQVLAGGLDWPTLLPGGQLVRGARTGYSVARSAGSVAGAAGFSTGIQEAALHDTQETRTLDESLLNIGGSMALGGLLGAGGAKLFSKIEWDQAVKSLDADLARVRLSASAPSNIGDYIKSTEYRATLHKPYFDADGNKIASSREVPFSGDLPPVGSWRISDDLKGIYGREIEQLVTLRVDDLKLPELVDGKLDPVKSGDDLRYADWIREGRRAPPIEVVQTDGGDFKVMDGHRRALAAKAAGSDTVEAWVSYSVPIPSGKLDSNGKPIMTGLTYEIAHPSASSGAPTSAGAAAVTPMEIEGNAIAGRAAGAVASATARLNPALRILQSPSAATREIGTQLFENSLYLKKNLDGVASEPAAETFMKEWNAGLARAVAATDDAFADYRKAGGPLSRPEFRDAVGRAMRNGDEADDPHITRVAKEWRSRVFDPLKEQAIAAKLLPEDVSVETAPSYFSRMWNRNRLIAEEPRFKAIVEDWLSREAPKWAEAFDKETIAKAAKLDGDKRLEFEVTRRVEREARFGDLRSTLREIADEVFNNLTGKTTEAVRPEFIKIKARGPLKERTFNIPDKLVEDFLESDVDVVGRRYARVMGADVEIARKFGSPDMVEQIQKIRDDYKALRAEATTEAERRALSDRETADVRDIEALRDLLRGTRLESPIERNYGRLMRMANMVNYIRSMGEVVLASLTDAIRPAMVHGLRQFMQTVPQLLSNLKAVRMSVDEAQLAGNVVETVLGHRLATISEIVDPYASRGPVEAFLENTTNVASKWNGIRIWTDMMKSVASVMTQNRILTNVADYKGVKPAERKYLAFLGIDQSMAERIATQFKAHGENIDGVRVANTESWTDDVARRTYRAAMNKDVDSIIVMKGVADVPLFASTPTGRMLLQFKSFALASHQRILIRGLQEDQTRFLGGVVAMTAMGMLMTYLKGLSGNRSERQSSFFDNPGWWIAEGLDRSGVLSVPMELANTFERATTVNPIKAPLKLADRDSAMSQKMQNRNEVGALLGPTAGLAQDAMVAGGIPRRMYDGEEVTRGQKNALERLAPFNSFPGIRQMLRYFVNDPD